MDAKKYTHFHRNFQILSKNKISCKNHGNNEDFCYFCQMPDYKRIFTLFVAGKVDEFYHELYPGLIAYACRELGDNLAYLAEDCVQDAVLQSYNKRRDFSTSMAWYAYILKCIFHAAVHQHRKNESHATYVESLSREHPEKAIEADALEQETLDRLYAAVESLPEEYRQILRMSFREGLKNAEIAARLGVAEITVKKKKARILSLLSERMGDLPPAIVLLLLETASRINMRG